MSTISTFHLIIVLYIMKILSKQKTIYTDQKAITGKEYKLNFDPFTTERIEINVKVYNC